MAARMLAVLAVVLMSGVGAAQAAKRIDLDYRVQLVPELDQARVEMVLEKGEAVRGIVVLHDDPRYTDFEADGEWVPEEGRSIWRPSPGKARLRWNVQVTEARANGALEARMTEDWALFRGEDLLPTMELTQAEGVELVTRLQFALPKGWRGVETGWPRIGENRFRIDDPSRLFDRPSGWMLAGRIGSRRAKLGETNVTVAAPIGEKVRRMDILTLLTFVWPEAQNAFHRSPKKLLIVGAGDPMWRGGLSGPNSLYMHAERPLVSENGTSSLVHELVHVFTRIRDTDQSDWITEGLAEYYAIELLRRAGGMTEERYQQVRKHLIGWSRDVKSLRTDNATGPITARAVLYLQDLDREIRQASKNRHSLDDLTRALMRLDRVTTDDFIALSEALLGGPAPILKSRLLR